MQVCAEPGCPAPAAYRGRCRTHARRHDQQVDRAGYHVYRTRRWRRTRDRHLYDHPLCVRCGRLATDVHHVTDLAQGGDPWDPANLQALCHACHARETRRRQLPPAP